MKQSICYLYEYDGDRQTKNVGFLKCIFQKDKVTFQIHGKGLDCDKFMDLEMFLFTSNEEEYKVDRAGTVEGEQGIVNYMVTVEALNSVTMNAYDGVLFESANHKQYVATWKQKNIYLRRVATEEESAYDEEDAHDEEDVREQQEVRVDEQDVRQGEICYEEIECQKEIVCEQVVECQEALECNQEEICEEIDLSEKVEEKKREMTRGQMKENQMMQGQTEQSQMPQDQMPQDQMPQNQITYEKISRHGIAGLPQREWKLANNNFLLHGYTNYKHLMLIREKGKLYLGIPGVYHKKEEMAAKSFGFPIFHLMEEAAALQVEVEWNAKEQFGYWCRPVTERRGVEQRYDRYEYTR